MEPKVITEHLNPNKSYLLEEAFTLTKGKGFFNYMVLFILLINYNLGSFVVFNLTYLVKPQKYMCEDQITHDWKACLPKQFCNDPSVKWEVDRSAPDYLFNWYEELNM